MTSEACPRLSLFAGRLLAGLLVVAVVATTCVPDLSVMPRAVPHEPVMLTFGYPFPAGHLLRRQILEPWANDLELATGSTITVEFHPE